MNLDIVTLKTVISFAKLYAEGLRDQALELQKVYTSGFRLSIANLPSEQYHEIQDLRHQAQGVRLFTLELEKLGDINVR